MSQVKLSDEEVQKLIECIQSGAEVPEDPLPSFFIMPDDSLMLVYHNYGG